MATLSSIDSGLPFGDFRALIERLPPLDERAAARVRDDFGRIEKPENSLGRIEKVAAWLAASTGRPPAVRRCPVPMPANNRPTTPRKPGLLRKLLSSSCNDL